ncbi:MAG: 2Fe-2S iron-sulfur cluster binding domain-containing protein [Bdellovibrio sp.]|nr:2Fe-2S iron-sulfur cluster binding domain-containing protein [Bdellovibrio sp.]
MPNIHIPQKNKTLTVAPAENLMQALQTAGIPVASSCLGDGICSMCKMTIEGVVPLPSELELRTAARNKLSSAERLSCQITVTADLTVTTTYW